MNGSKQPLYGVLFIIYPGNFASSRLVPIRASLITTPRVTMRTAVSNPGVIRQATPNLTRRIKTAADRIKNKEDKRIFVFNKGVIIFLNLILPSNNPPKKDRITVSGRNKASSFTVA